MTGSDREGLLRVADRDIRQIERERLNWASPLAQLLSAGEASVRGRCSVAKDLLVAAEAALEAADMALYAAAARRCRGLLLGGREGRSLVEAADIWMRGERIRNPERMTAMLAPGQWAAIDRRSAS